MVGFEDQAVLWPSLASQIASAACSADACSPSLSPDLTAMFGSIYTGVCVALPGNSAQLASVHNLNGKVDDLRVSLLCTRRSVAGKALQKGASERRFEPATRPRRRKCYDLLAANKECSATYVVSVAIFSPEESGEGDSPAAAMGALTIGWQCPEAFTERYLPAMRHLAAELAAYMPAIYAALIADLAIVQPRLRCLASCQCHTQMENPKGHLSPRTSCRLALPSPPEDPNGSSGGLCVSQDSNGGLSARPSTEKERARTSGEASDASYGKASTSKGLDGTEGLALPDEALWGPEEDEKDIKATVAPAPEVDLRQFKVSLHFVSPVVEQAFVTHMAQGWYKMDLFCLIAYAASFIHICINEPNKIAFRPETLSMVIPGTLVFVTAITIVTFAKDWYIARREIVRLAILALIQWCDFMWIRRLTNSYPDVVDRLAPHFLVTMPLLHAFDTLGPKVRFSQAAMVRMPLALVLSFMPLPWVFRQGLRGFSPAACIPLSATLIIIFGNIIPLWFCHHMEKKERRQFIEARYPDMAERSAVGDAVAA